MNTKKLVFAGVFIALGLLLPQAFHLIGGTGPVFLPMHIPVLLAGFFLGGPTGAIVGILTVILSASLTGMPQVPITYFMLFELASYGFAAGLLYKTFKLNPYVSLIGAMIIGRLVLAVAVFTLQPLLGLKLSPQVYMTGAIVNGIPGIIIQLLIVPVIVMAMEKAGLTKSMDTSKR